MPIAKLNVYDGVPIGPKNFQSFFDSMSKSVNSILEFSLRNVNGTLSSGGYIETNPVVFLPLGTQSSSLNSRTFRFLSGVNGDGILFGKLDGSFYRFQVPALTNISDLEVSKWVILPSKDEYAADDTKILFSNDFTKNDSVLKLPIRPAYGYRDNLGRDIANYGFYEVRFNGVVQSAYTYNHYNGIGVSLQFDNLVLGAESPEIVSESGKYLRQLGEKSNGATLYDYKSVFSDSTTTDSFRVAFPHTNFNIEGGGHIVIVSSEIVGDPNSTRKYAYIPADLSGTSNEADYGTYKVVDASNGIISINVSMEQLRAISFNNQNPSDVVFKILSAEQLVEEVSDTSIKYKSRYGDVYDGKSLNTELINVNFSGGEYVTSAPFKANISYTSDSGRSIIYESAAGLFSDSLLLAIKYGCKAYVDVNSQKSKHIPDVFELYYTQGIDEALYNSTTPDKLLGGINLNSCSWYNWDVNAYEFYPVARSVSSDYSIVIQGEQNHHVFNSAFSVTNPVLRLTWGVPKFTYAHASETTLGVTDEMVRSDAKIPEPHHINAPMIKKLLNKETYIPDGEQVLYFNEVFLDADVYIDGDFVVL